MRFARLCRTCAFLVAVPLLVLALAAAAHARPGDLDRSFGDRGRLALNHGGGFTGGLALEDGRRPVLSFSSLRANGPGPTILRLTAGGRSAGETLLAPPANGAPLLAGDATLVRLGGSRFLLGPSGPALTVPRTDFDARGFAVDRTGRTRVVGWSYVGSTAEAIAVRFLADGTLDAIYGRGGVARIATGFIPDAVLIRPDGRTYVAGGEDGGDDTRVLALDADGGRLAGFSARGLRSGRLAAFDAASAIVPGPAGTLLVAGTVSRRRVDRAGIVRLDARGRVDRRFGDRGLLRADPALNGVRASDIARDRRGRIVLAGTQTVSTASPYQAAVVRVSSRGRVDRSFGTRGRVVKQLGRLRGVNLIASEARFVDIDDRGRIVIAGEAYDDDYLGRDDVGYSYPAIARLKG